MDRVDIGQVAAFVAELERAYEDDCQIFVVGNGSSASTASHLPCELAKTVLGRKPDPQRRRFRVMSLTHITGSGNSPSVVNAVRMAREMGLRTTGMLRFDGGEVLPLRDTPLLIPDFSDGFVETCTWCWTTR
jgi:D-sedoheptulose 7-phosphate isomerase